MKRKQKPNRKTVRQAIRGMVPGGKLSSAKILLSESKYGAHSVAGFTEFDKARGGKVVKLGAPSGDDAASVCVRGHETRHATHTHPLRSKPMTPNEAMAFQAVD